MATEMFKVKLGIAPVIMNVFRIRKNDYNTRKADAFQSHCVKTVHYGTETVSFLGPKLWSILPNEYKSIINIYK